MKWYWYFFFNSFVHLLVFRLAILLGAQAQEPLYDWRICPQRILTALKLCVSKTARKIYIFFTYISYILSYITHISAPLLFSGTYNKVLPYILMGSLTIASSVVNFFLPETLNRDLPETVEQMQECQG